MTEQEGLGHRPEKGKGKGSSVESCLGRGREGWRSRPLTLSERIHLEARHFLGQDGLGQVEEGGVVDREVMVILLQDPHCHSLDAVGGDGRRGREKRQTRGTGEGTHQGRSAGLEGIYDRDKLLPGSLAQA